MAVPRWTTGPLLLYVGLMMMMMIPAVWCSFSTHPASTTDLSCYVCTAPVTDQPVPTDCGTQEYVNEVNTTIELASGMVQGCFAMFKEKEGSQLHIQRGDLSLLFNGTSMMEGALLSEKEMVFKFNGYICNTNLCNFQDPEYPDNSDDGYYYNNGSDHDMGTNYGPLGEYDDNEDPYTRPPNSYVAAYPVVLLPVLAGYYGTSPQANPNGMNVYNPQYGPSPQANPNGMNVDNPHIGSPRQANPNGMNFDNPHIGSPRQAKPNGMNVDNPHIGSPRQAKPNGIKIYMPEVGNGMVTPK